MACAKTVPPTSVELDVKVSVEAEYCMNPTQKANVVVGLKAALQNANVPCLLEEQCKVGNDFTFSPNQLIVEFLASQSNISHVISSEFSKNYHWCV